MRHPYRRSRLPRLLASTSRSRCSHSRMKSSSNPPLRLWVNLIVFRVRRSLPVYPNKQTNSEPVGTSHLCQQETHALLQITDLSDHPYSRCEYSMSCNSFGD